MIKTLLSPQRTKKKAPHIDLALQGVEIVANGSGSHHQLRKLDERLALIRGATRKGAGVYLYSNQRGCDGGRLYYDGCACVAANGELVAQGAQFGLREVEVVAATVDLDAVVARRQGASSQRGQAAATAAPEYVEVRGGFALCHGWEARGYRERAAASAAASMGAAAGGGGNEGVANDAAAAAAAAPAAAAPTMTTTTTTATRKPRLPAGVPPPVSPPIRLRVHLPEEEIAYGPAAWLWDYLRRSGAGGFLLPLSGGADSASVAAIVAAMCRMVARAVAEGDARVIADAARIGRYDLSAGGGGFGGGGDGGGKGGAGGGGADDPDGGGDNGNGDGNGNGDKSAGSAGRPWTLDPKEFASRVFTTVYMGSGASSSPETRRRAARLAAEVGSLHLCLDIDKAVAAALGILSAATRLLPGGGRLPRFRSDGGSAAENLALQNVQARLRMVLAFLLAQLVPWARRAPPPVGASANGSGASGGGGAPTPTPPPPPLPPPSFLLVLGASNVDEALRGYLTKYDCSAADVNPIGGVSKADLRRLLRWAAGALALPSLAEIEAAPPTAELEPLKAGQPPQTDEADMGCTYDDLGALGRLRQVARCGPVAAYRRLVAAWGWERRLLAREEEEEGQQQQQQQRQRDKDEAAGGAAGTRSPPPPPPPLPPLEVARRVKHFFTHYAVNRHKATVLPPSYHAESYSPDDNRFDHRQFLYNVRWPWQFARIDEEARVAQIAWDSAKGDGDGGAQ